MKAKMGSIFLILSVASLTTCFFDLDNHLDLVDIPDLPSIEEELALDQSPVVRDRLASRRRSPPSRKTKKNASIQSADRKQDKGADTETDEDDSDDRQKQKIALTNLAESLFSNNKAIEAITDIIEDDNLDDNCNPDLLRAFGINVRGKVKPLKHTDETLEICRWNRMTCCTVEDFASFQKFFHKGLRKLYQEMYMTEQLLLMFNGKQEIISFEKLKYKVSCHSYLEEVEDSQGRPYYTNEGKDQLSSFFNDTVRATEIFKGSLLAVDVRDYFYGIRNLYGSLICTFCSSIDNAYIQMSTNKTTLRINHMTMDKLIELLDFEVRLAKFLHYYVRPFANVVRCANNLLDKVDYSIEAIDIAKVEKTERLVYYCSMDSHTFRKFCQGVLRFNMYGRMGLFNSPNIIKQSLKVLFKQFYSLEIEDFYRDYFGATFRLNEEVYTNFYDKHNEESKKYRMTDIQVTLEEDGMDLVENDVSPIYFDLPPELAGVGRWSVGLLIGLVVGAFV
jgi:hypothetical protein